METGRKEFHGDRKRHLVERLYRNLVHKVAPKRWLLPQLLWLVILLLFILCLDDGFLLCLNCRPIIGE